MGDQLFQTAAQPTWIGIVPLGWVTAVVDWTSSTSQVLWEKNELNFSVESGQEMNCLLGKNQQKFQKSHPHPLGTAEEEQLHCLEPQLWATSLIPPSHCQKPLPGHPTGVRKGDKERKRVEEKRNQGDRRQGDPLELQVWQGEGPD